MTDAATTWELCRLAALVTDISPLPCEPQPALRALLLAEDLPAARRASEAWLRAYPWYSDGWHLLALLHWQAGAEEAALAAASEAITLAQRYHPVIHFAQSALLSHRAVLVRAHGMPAQAQADAAAALFQDHDNTAAQALLADKDQPEVALPAYTRHIFTARRRQRALRRVPLSQALSLSTAEAAHDAALRRWRQGALSLAEAALTRLITAGPFHPCLPLYLLYLHRSMLRREAGWSLQALTDATIALTLLHHAHGRYHRYAAYQYLTRCYLHQRTGQPELARMDAIRAADMDKGLCIPPGAWGAGDQTLPSGF